LVDLIDHLDVANVQLTSFPMLIAIVQSRHAQARVAWTFAVKHVDNNAHDLAELVQRSNGLDMAAQAQLLMAISPQSPYAKAVLIEKDWVQAKRHLAEWEQDANKSPAILAALAKRYNELGKFDETQSALLRYIRFSPDYWAYEQLAKNYRQRGDLEHWQSILEQFLAKTEDHGLAHARVRAEIANH
jgi:tetratricopeptide (TPR) repeat protein